ncbi:MAG: hypothetical protein HWN67_02265 [Candidatus Helarchaeota archaeon]|nr:hypothetical protein [Candidatus Helarchaeota archaeon]
MGNISKKEIETKKSLALKIIYESVYGLDEILNILFTEDVLRQICEVSELKIIKKSKKNMIGIIIKSLPTKRKRKIETVIDEHIEDSERLIIYNLFVMYKSGICLFSYNLEPLEIGDSSLITSALNAINSLIMEITQTNTSLDSIDIKEKHLIFEYIGDIVGVLLVNKETIFAKKLLYKFLSEFNEIYKKEIYPWKGNTAIFEDAEDLIKKYFASYFIQ